MEIEIAAAAAAKEYYLCDDIVVKILDRVPLKPRTRLKCVSKHWGRLITYLRHSSPPTTSSGLFLTFANWSEFRITHLAQDDQGKECILQRSLKPDLGFHHTVTRPWPLLVGSVNGLLLYHDGTQFIISNPGMHQSITLPPIESYMDKNTLHAALFSHESDSSSLPQIDRFKVICFTTNNINDTITYYIFSSHTGEWENHQAKLFNRSLYSNTKSMENNPPCVYNDGKLYWLYSYYNPWPLMLVYNIDRQFFKLVVPQAQKGCNKYHYLYESEGCLHYCERSLNDLIIWTDLDEDGDDNNDCDDDHPTCVDGSPGRRRSNKVKGRMVHSINCDILTEEIKERYGWEDARRFREIGKPIAFNEELQMLYLMDKGGIYMNIWAYSLETRTITNVLSGVNPSFYSQRFVLYIQHLKYIRVHEQNNNTGVSRDKAKDLQNKQATL